VRLRVFLFKRAIHTIITLLVVLVLLFIIFRLMPGDPTRFFIEPGQTQDTRDRLLVKFGFRHWVDGPGIYREHSFDGSRAGPYQIIINVTDEDLNEQTLFAAFNVDEEFAQTDLKVFVWADPLLINEQDDGGLEFFNEPPLRQATAEVDQSVTILASVESPSPTANIEVRGDMNYFNPLTGARDPVFSDVLFTAQGNIYSSAPQTPGEAGLYEVTVRAQDLSGTDSITINYAFAVNLPDAQIAPFHLAEDEGELFTYLDELTNNGRASIAIESDAAKILKVRDAVYCTVVLPDGNIDDGTMIHPRITAERNIFEQFWVYFTSMLQLDFGNSFYSQREVWTEIQEKAPPTILLFGTSLILQAVFGVLIGVLLAWRRGTRMEISAVVVALFFYSMPLFWFGIILIWAFAFQLGWFPFGGMVTPELWAGSTPDLLTQISDIGTHMVLPLITLMMVGLAFTILLMRNSMLEVLGEDYITTAKAKGLSERKVMYKHAARNAMLPVVTVVAISVGSVVSGGVLTETIFSWPGMGYYLVDSTLKQDYPAVQGVFFLLAVLTILANVAADVLYAFMDPRVRL
jgi:peptide/nickel transport system permease protein